jgi:hypothetical protein
MKVSNVGSTRQADTARRKKVSGKSGEFADHLKDAAPASDVAGPFEAPAVGGMDSVLSIQEVPDALDEQARRQAVDRGGQLLDKLDQLRLRLLEGSIPKDQLAELARAVRARRQMTTDPHLVAIIDEIELRAEVEIAKLTRDA